MTWNDTHKMLHRFFKVICNKSSFKSYKYILIYKYIYILYAPVSFVKVPLDKYQKQSPDLPSFPTEVPNWALGILYLRHHEARPVGGNETTTPITIHGTNGIFTHIYHKNPPFM